MGTHFVPAVHHSELLLLQLHLALRPHCQPRPTPPTPRTADKGQRVLGRPFWRHYAHGIIDWLVVNVVLYLCLAAQVRTGCAGLS